jgi:hypothetical protein
MIPNVKKSNKWECACGNTPELRGFYPCDQDGEVYYDVLEFTPEEYQAWYPKQTRHIVRCNTCGLIIDCDNLTVLGKSPEYVTWDADWLIEQIERERQEQTK